MGKVCRVTHRTKTQKNRKGFNGHKSTANNNADVDNISVNINIPVNINTEPSTVNNVNTESNIFVNNESHDNSVYIQSEININSYTASASSQKIQDFVASRRKETDSITGNRIIDTSILSNGISMLLCPMSNFVTW